MSLTRAARGLPRRLVALTAASSSAAPAPSLAGATPPPLSATAGPLSQATARPGASIHGGPCSPWKGFASEAAEEPREYQILGDKVKAMERLLAQPPAPLDFHRMAGRPKEGWEESTWGRTLLWAGGYYTKESRGIRGGKLLYDIAMEQATNLDVREGLMIRDEFPCQQGFISLHMWLCLARLRQEGAASKTASQTLYDLFQEDVEVRVRAAGVKVRISKWLTELEQRFLAAAVAYDKALENTDMKESKEQLADALYTYVYNGEGDRSHAHLLQRYVRRELASMTITDSEAILAGQIKFSHPIP